MSGGDIVFEGRGPGKRGLYAHMGGSLIDVIDSNDMLDGKMLTNVEITPEALSGNQIVFMADFTDGSQGLYIATLALPADLDADGDVDQDDLGIVVGCFGQFVADNSDCAIADVAPPPDGDGVINILDISFVGSNFTP